MRRNWTHNRAAAVASALTLTSISQKELAEILADVTGEKWTRGMVANRNTGHPPGWTDEQISIIAQVTGLPLWWFDEDPRTVALATSSNVDGAMGRYLKQNRPLRNALGFRLTPQVA